MTFFHRSASSLRPSASGLPRTSKASCFLLWLDRCSSSELPCTRRMFTGSVAARRPTFTRSSPLSTPTRMEKKKLSGLSASASNNYTTSATRKLISSPSLVSTWYEQSPSSQPFFPKTCSRGPSSTKTFGLTQSRRGFKRTSKQPTSLSTSAYQPTSSLTSQS